MAPLPLPLLGVTVAPPLSRLEAALLMAAADLVPSAEASAEDWALRAELTAPVLPLRNEAISLSVKGLKPERPLTSCEMS